MEKQRLPSFCGGVIVVALLAVLILPVFYMLASGPVVWLMAHGYISEALGHELYYVPNQIAFRSEWFNDCWQVYLNLWRHL